MTCPPPQSDDRTLNSPLLALLCLAALFLISLANYHLISVSYTTPMIATRALASWTVPLLSIVLLATLSLLIHLTRHRLVRKRSRLALYVGAVVLGASATGNHVQVLREGGLDVDLRLSGAVLSWDGVVPQRMPDIDRILKRAGGDLDKIIVSDLSGFQYINAENMAIYLASSSGGVDVTGKCSNACALFWLMNEKRALSSEGLIGLPGDSGEFAAPHEIFVAVLTSALHNAGADLHQAEQMVRGIPKGAVKWMSRDDLVALNVALLD